MRGVEIVVFKNMVCYWHDVINTNDWIHVTNWFDRSCDNLVFSSHIIKKG